MDTPKPLGNVVAETQYGVKVKGTNKNLVNGDKWFKFEDITDLKDGERIVRMANKDSAECMIYELTSHSQSDYSRFDLEVTSWTIERTLQGLY